eukprot:5748719-Amphidinium_carterae.1
MTEVAAQLALLGLTVNWAKSSWTAAIKPDPSPDLPTEHGVVQYADRTVVLGAELCSLPDETSVSERDTLKLAKVTGRLARVQHVP